VSDVLVRGIDERDLALLERRAEACGRSLQAELKRILLLAARPSEEGAARELAERVCAALTGKSHPERAALFREGREQ
jgi:hypothetical protein